MNTNEMQKKKKNRKLSLEKERLIALHILF